VAEALHFYREEIDWTELLERAQAYDLVLPLQQALPLAAGALGASFPAAAAEGLAGLQPSAQERELYRWFTAAPWSGIESGWVSLAGLPGWRSRLNFLRAHLLPPAAYLRRRYGVHHAALLPLLYVWRWLVGAGSGLAVAAALARRRAGRLR
jgi:hypothetical protein